MSRHRLVRNMDISEMEDDDYYQDEGDDGMSPEDAAQLALSLERVKEIMGEEKQSGVPDSAVKDALWEYYFDIGQTVEWMQEEQKRMAAARERQAAREREKAEKAQKLAAQKAAAEAKMPVKKATKGSVGGAATPARKKGDAVTQRDLDLSGLNLNENDAFLPINEEPPPKVAMAQERLLEEVRLALDSQSKEKLELSLVVIGHVDAGKSTLMGRLLYELGFVEEKKRLANERASDQLGKASFSWAWELDGTTEERERGITMDIAIQSLSTPHRQITILDAPGHKDFIPNMISGASQADCALLVVDASTGEFEAGFERGGQTREHLVLVRSLGVSQVVVAINKLDTVDWEQSRFDEIVGLLTPFLQQTGFTPSKTKFAPVGAMSGINLLNRDAPEATRLKEWYQGPTLVDLLDKLEPPARNITAPLRIPVSNVFRGQSSGIGIAGRICGGIVQVGEKLRILPGDESGVVKSIFVKDEPAPWATDGTNVAVYIVGVDPIHLNIGTVLCTASNPVPLSSVFTARIIIFDIQVPITAGTSIELFHQSQEVPASISKLIATLDRGTGSVVKQRPRVLAKGASAEVEISLRVVGMAGPTTKTRSLPVEPFSVNKEMGRILIRRGGETIGAGIVQELKN